MAREKAPLLPTSRSGADLARRAGCITLLALLLLVPAAARAMVSQDQSGQGLSFADGRACPANTTDIVIEKFGKCRWLDNTSSKDLLCPYRSVTELCSLVERASDLSVSLCRQPYAVDWDYAADTLAAEQRMSPATTEDAAEPGGGWSTPVSILSGALTRFYAYPQTRSAALDETQSNSVTYSRKDCRVARTGETLCRDQVWTETGRVRFVYTPSTDDPRDCAARDGQWTVTPLDKLGGAVPAFSAPEALACPPGIANGPNRVAEPALTVSGPWPGECPDGAGTRQHKGQSYRWYACEDGVNTPTASVDPPTAWSDEGSCAEPPQPGLLDVIVFGSTCMPGGKAAADAIGNAAWQPYPWLYACLNNDDNDGACEAPVGQSWTLADSAAQYEVRRYELDRSQNPAIVMDPVQHRGMYCSSRVAADWDTSWDGAEVTFELGPQLDGRTGAFTAVIPYDPWDGIRSQAEASAVLRNYQSYLNVPIDEAANGATFGGHGHKQPMALAFAFNVAQDKTETLIDKTSPGVSTQANCSHGCYHRFKVVAQYLSATRQLKVSATGGDEWKANQNFANDPGYPANMFLHYPQIAWYGYRNAKVWSEVRLVQAPPPPAACVDYSGWYLDYARSSGPANDALCAGGAARDFDDSGVTTDVGAGYLWGTATWTCAGIGTTACSAAALAGP